MTRIELITQYRVAELRIVAVNMYTLDIVSLLSYVQFDVDVIKHLIASVMPKKTQ